MISCNSVLLQAPILAVLKRHGDMLELVLSSLQVPVGLALLSGIALPSSPCPYMISLLRILWHGIA